MQKHTIDYVGPVWPVLLKGNTVKYTLDHRKSRCEMGEMDGKQLDLIDF